MLLNSIRRTMKKVQFGSEELRFPSLEMGIQWGQITLNGYSWLALWQGANRIT